MGRRKLRQKRPDAATAAPPAPSRPAIADIPMTGSPGLAAWMDEQNVSIACTTYHSGLLFFIGLDDRGALAANIRHFERAMGFAASREEIYLGTSHMIWRFRNVLAPGQVAGAYDGLYLPRTCHVTGTVDVHDMAIEQDGRLVFVNTLFSCLSTLDPDHSFRVIWKPWWVSQIVAEDRSHMNGIALRDGRVRYLTAAGMTDTLEGWRAGRVGGGVIVDVQENEVVASGLTMPHSPRWHNGQLYLLESGSGHLGRIDMATGKFEPVCFCPGFARGLAFVGNYAVLGLSDQRVNRTFSDMALDKNLKDHNARPGCGILIIHLESGEIEHRITFGGVVKELYEVVAVQGIRRPNVIGFATDEVRRMVTIA